MPDIARTNIVLALSRVPAHLPVEACWPWLGYVRPSGYGAVSAGHGESEWVAHRLVYELMVGPVPEGLDLDHLCRTRACVNPWHVGPVTRGVNVLRGVGTAARNARKTHCKRGHPFEGEGSSVYVATGRGRPQRQCNHCRRLRGWGNR